MNRPVPRALTRAAYIIAAILVAYFIFSFLSLVIGRGDWMLALLAVLIALSIGLPFIDKAFGDKLPFLSQWPTTSVNAKIRSIIGLRFFGGDKSFNNPQTGKQVAVNMLWVFSIFLFLLAVVSIRLYLGRPVSDTLANILGAVFMSSTVMAAFHFMALRLRTKYDLRSVLLAIAIYTPIIMVALGVFLVWGEIIDDGPFRISIGLLLFILPFSVFMTALAAFLPNLRKSVRPSPRSQPAPSTNPPKYPHPSHPWPPSPRSSCYRPSSGTRRNSTRARSSCTCTIAEPPTCPIPAATAATYFWSNAAAISAGTSTSRASSVASSISFASDRTERMPRRLEIPVEHRFMPAKLRAWSTTVSVSKVKPVRPDEAGSCSRAVSPRECLDALQR